MSLHTSIPILAPPPRISLQIFKFTGALCRPSRVELSRIFQRPGYERHDMPYWPRTRRSKTKENSGCNSCNIQSIPRNTMRAPNIRLVDRHSARLWRYWASVLHVRKLCEIVGLFVSSNKLPPRHKRLEALVEVVHANTCVDDCQQNEYNG